MVRRKTQAPPLRLARHRTRYRPAFPLRIERFTLLPLTFTAAAIFAFARWVSGLLAFVLLTAGSPAFACMVFARLTVGLLTSAFAIAAATFVVSTGSLVALAVTLAVSGKTGRGSGRTCASSSLLKAVPSSRRPAPGNSVVTTSPGSPSSFQASAASSSSSLSLSSPAMIASAIKPAF